MVFVCAAVVPVRARGSINMFKTKEQYREEALQKVRLAMGKEATDGFEPGGPWFELADFVAQDFSVLTDQVQQAVRLTAMPEQVASMFQAILEALLP